MKKVLLWAVILAVVFAAGFAVAAATYRPPDPVMDQVSTTAPSPHASATPKPGGPA